MADDRLSLSNEEESQSGALLPVTALPQSNGEWNGVAVKESSADSARLDPMIYVHAVRRHWLVSLGIGLLGAAIAGPAVWIIMGTQYTAHSYLKVSISENTVIGNDNMGAMDRDRFEIYKSTQQTLLLTRVVLQSALRKPEVKDIPIIQYQTQYGDAVDWLTKNISVSFPGKAEFMAVSITREDPDEAKTLVQAVVDSYITEVVNADSVRKQHRFSELETICNEKQQEMRTKREELKGLVAKIGASDTEAINTRGKLFLEELGILRNEVARNAFDVAKARGELAAQKSLLDNVDKTDVPEIDVDQLMQADPVAKQLSIELGWKKVDQIQVERATRPGVNNPFATRHNEELRVLQQQFDEQKKKMVAKARQKSRNHIESEILRLKALLEPMESQQRETKEKVVAMTEQAAKIVTSTVDIQMLQADLRFMEQTALNLTSERERLKVEIKSAPRISVWEPAEKPLTPSNTGTRTALTFMAIMMSLGCPAVLIALFDTRTRRINTAADVSRGLQLPVIGSMPLVPARVIRQLGSPSPRHRVWHLRLTESIDSIAARLLRKADVEQCRVIMVSSATGGEGKTTLTTQLALSLARTGRRIVLVDFDLRRPAFDEIFGVPLTPGVSESLRHENDLDSLVHQTSTDNLCVVTAGRWDRQALASLSNGGVGSLFKQLREQFDFIVIDTSPILPVADARFVSQFVDTVVLSVFRDVSEAHKIQAACDILAAFGVHSLEAVVTGQNSNLYGRHTGYQSTVSA
jgi:capsular exopolysaccharide synthesis family protein